MDAVRAVQTQADVSEADARRALEQTKGDVMEAILYLLNVPPPPVKPKTAWDERREICADYEESMNQFVQQHSRLQPAGDASGAAKGDASATAPPIRVIPAPKRI